MSRSDATRCPVVIACGEYQRSERFRVPFSDLVGEVLDSPMTLRVRCCREHDLVRRELCERIADRREQVVVAADGAVRLETRRDGFGEGVVEVLLGIRGSVGVVVRQPGGASRKDRRDDVDLVRLAGEPGAYGCGRVEDDEDPLRRTGRLASSSSEAHGSIGRSARARSEEPQRGSLVRDPATSL
jgi:hypothetical protein